MTVSWLGEVTHAPEKSITRRCLLHGEWQPPPVEQGTAPSPTLGKWMHTRLSKHESLRCKASRAGVESRRWQGRDAGCDAVLHHPATGDFGGLYNASNPIELVLLGDSMMRNLAVALSDLVQVNHHLRGLVVRPAGLLSIIPSSYGRCEQILRELPFKGQLSEGSRRVLLVGTGTWYNLLPLCLFPTLGGSMRRGIISEACPRWLADARRKELKPNHTATAQPVHWSHHGHGNYAYMRQAAGTTTISEYTSDVSTLLDAIDSWRAANPRARVAWIESSPQHFWPNGTGLPDACNTEPHVFMQPGGEAEGVLPPAARELCASTLREPAALRDCTRPAALHDWRNRVTAPLLAAHTLPVVPLFAALSARGEQHAQPGADCTHWCEASEANLHMVSATLNLLATLLG